MAGKARLRGLDESGDPMSTALITGGSAGLGRALATALATSGWRLIITGRDSDRLRAVAAELAASTAVTAIAGNVADATHRHELIAEVARIGPLDLLVNNASSLGPTPLRALAELSTDDVRDVLAVNVTGPFALTAALLPALTTAKGTVIAISSDAAVEHYPDWGGYGASKAALDHLTLTFGVENLDIACYAIDPGDMLTDMARDAFPGEDIGDRRSPTEVVPALLDLIQHRPPDGRYRAGDGVAVPADASGTRPAEPATR
jgi:NAD(P)-dependent dehydrogenase (short-subunit alcohol dehydrogenase family)